MTVFQKFYHKYHKLARNAIITLFAFAFMAFFAVIAVSIKPLDPLTETVSSFSFTDIYYSIIKETAPPDTSHAITIVDIYMFQGRDNFAKLIEEIESYHPKNICVDAVFEGERPENIDGDMALMDVVEKHNNLIFSMKMEQVFTGENEEWVSGSTIHSFFKDYIPIHEAFCNLPRSNLYDAMKREIPIVANVDSSDVYSMAVEAANAYAGKDITYGRTNKVAINYTPMVFQKIKPEDVNLYPELIEGRIVFLGDLHDNNDSYWSPIGEKLAGVEILAYCTQTLLEKKEIKELSLLLRIILSFSITLCVLFLLQQYEAKTQKSENLFVQYFVGSTYTKNILIFIFTSALLGISFFIFSKWGISLSWGWTFSGIAFLKTAENMYSAIHNYIEQKSKKKRRIIKVNNMNTNKLLIFVIMLVSCLNMYSQDVIVSYVAGNVKATINGKNIDTKLNMKLNLSNSVEIPYEGKLELLDEKNCKKYSISNPGKGKISSLIATKGNSTSDITARYIAYLKKQIGDSNSSNKIMKAQVYTDFATVTREVMKKEEREEAAEQEKQIKQLPPRQRLLLQRELNHKKHDAFRDSVIKQHLDFVRKAWEGKDLEKALEKPLFKEIGPMVADPNKTPTDRVKLFDWMKRVVSSTNDKIVLKYNQIFKARQPKPAIAIEEIKPLIPEQVTDVYFPFTFFGTDMSVRLDETKRVNIGKFSPDRIANVLQRFSDGKYTNLVYDCLQLRTKHKLNDWAYFEMLETICNDFFGKGTNEAVLLTGFLCYQSGYAIRFAASPDANNLYLLVRSDYTIYGKRYISFDPTGARKFYIIDNDAPDKLMICEAGFHNEQGLSLYIDEQPIFTTEKTEVRTIQGYRNKQNKVSISVNMNLVKFYDTFPSSQIADDVTSRWAMYANTPLDIPVQDELYPQLKQLIEGKNEVEKVNCLMDLLHGIEYGYDDDIWGGDRPFFSEETLHYPVCDCEDRAILLTRLVRDLVGLRCALIYYPGHLATAIHFSSEQPGAAFIIDDTPYTVCDPTYFGSVVGEQMSSVDATQAKLVILE